MYNQAVGTILSPIYSERRDYGGWTDEQGCDIVATLSDYFHTALQQNWRQTHMAIKKDSTISVQTNGEARTIDFNVAGMPGITLHVERVSAALFEYAAFDRLRNRVVDAAAIPFNAEENRYATPSEKHAAMAELVGYLESGASEWSRRTQSGAGEGSLLLRALLRLRSDRTEQQIKAFLDGKTRAEKLKLLNSKQVRPIADAIRGESAQGVDGDELLSSL